MQKKKIMFLISLLYKFFILLHLITTMDKISVWDLGWEHWVSWSKVIPYLKWRQIWAWFLILSSIHRIIVKKMIRQMMIYLINCWLVQEKFLIMYPLVVSNTPIEHTTSSFSLKNSLWVIENKVIIHHLHSLSKGLLIHCPDKMIWQELFFGIKRH